MVRCLETLLADAVLERQRAVAVPFVYGFVEDGDARDGELFYVGREAGFGSDRADESVPAVGDAWVLEEGEVERDEGSGGAACSDAFVDGRVFGVCGLFGGVGDSHG